MPIRSESGARSDDHDRGSRRILVKRFDLVEEGVQSRGNPRPRIRADGRGGPWQR
jgi:hypothetical protein